MSQLVSTNKKKLRPMPLEATSHNLEPTPSLAGIEIPATYKQHIYIVTNFQC